MRGPDAASGALFSYVDMEARVPATHPLRTIRTIVNEVLTALDTEFEALYEGIGRQSVAPERLLRASLLQAFYSVRSERQLMEQINYNLLFRWFVGLGIDDAVWIIRRSRNPGAVARRRCRCQVPRSRSASSQGHALFVGRALFGRRHAGGSLGLAQEFPRQGRFRRATRARAQRRAAFPQREAQQRDACLDHGPGCQALSQRQQPGCQALMFAFKGQGAVFYSAAATAPIVVRTAGDDPKTPVEQGLMRGLGTA